MQPFTDARSRDLKELAKKVDNVKELHVFQDIEKWKKGYQVQTVRVVVNLFTFSRILYFNRTSWKI